MGFKMIFFLVLVILIGFSTLAFVKGNPTVFLLAAGSSIMAGLYTPDALTGLGYSTIGMGMGLLLIIYSFVCIALAYANLLKGER